MNRKVFELVQEFKKETYTSWQSLKPKEKKKEEWKKWKIDIYSYIIGLKNVGQQKEQAV